MAYFSSPTGKLDGHQISQKHLSPKPSPNPYAKHFYNKCQPPSQAIHRPLNYPVTYVASPTWPSLANVPRNATRYSKHLHCTQHTNSSQQPNTVTNMREQHQLPSSHHPLKPYYRSLTPSSRPPGGWRMSAQTRPPSTRMDVDYNLIQLQSMPCALYLTHPENPSIATRYLIRPPRIRSDLKGDAHWAPWWRTTILVQSPTSLPFPSMLAHIIYIYIWKWPIHVSPRST